MPGLGGYASVADHVLQLLDAVVGQRGDGFVGTGIDADDVAIGQIIVVRDDRFKKFDILAQHFSDIEVPLDL